MKLRRIDYLQVGSLNCNSLQILPVRSVKVQQKVSDRFYPAYESGTQLSESNQNLRSKLVIGDHKGILQLVGIRKGEAYADFKFDLGQPIHSVGVHVNPGTCA